ncbi:hypothetical protein ACKLNO_01015 [Neisseriaceae bacterium B1]
MIQINKGFIIMAAIGYGCYHFFTHNNVTIIPPSKNAVKTAVKKVKPEFLTRGDLNVPDNCTRIGGTALTDGVFSCKIELNSNYAGTEGLDKITLVKKDGKWVWQR